MAERASVVLYVVVALGLFILMPFWGWIGAGKSSLETYDMAPDAFAEKVTAMMETYATGEEENGIVVVRPPPGDIYLEAMQFSFSPILELEAGQSYRLHVASSDILHGFHFPLGNADVMLLPGRAVIVPLQPSETGRFAMQCSENCGLDHNRMKGQLRVIGSQ